MNAPIHEISPPDNLKQMRTSAVIGNDVFLEQAAAIVAVGQRLGQEFNKAVQLLLQMKGRLIVMGVGKSGLIGKKIAATLASTGTPSFFVHPTEAFHGDLGMVKSLDVALMISYSGETDELLKVVPYFQSNSIKIIALTGGKESNLAKNANVVLDVAVPKEVCPHNLAPTTSTTATVVMGDALAVALMTARDFQPQDFARFHPGGSLGRRLLTHVRDVMHRGDLPVVEPGCHLRTLVDVMTRGRLGLALVMERQQLKGIVTDGDLRRAWATHPNPIDLRSDEIMTRTPKLINANERFAIAEEYMRENKISSLVVTADGGEVVGVLQIFDL